MQDELVRRLAQLEARLDRLAMPEISPDLAGPLLALPMLRGAWVASVDSGGDWYDVSGHGHTLTYNGNPTFNYAGLAPYWDLDGDGDYFSRADEADLDILATETYVAAAARGLTLGGWFRPDSTAAQAGCITKWDAGVSQSYLLDIPGGASNNFRIIIDDAGVLVTRNSTVAITTGNWYFVAGVFRPGSSLDIHVNLTKDTVATARAAITNSTAPLNIGAINGGSFLNGQVTLCFLCAAALSDATIGSLFQQQRAAFGV